jgi:hypothetical protein
MEGKESLERIFAQLSDEQKEQFRNCKDMDEVMKLADEENFELTDDQLEFLASGGCGCGASLFAVSRPIYHGLFRKTAKNGHPRIPA